MVGIKVNKLAYCNVRSNTEQALIPDNFRVVMYKICANVRLCEPPPLLLTNAAIPRCTYVRGNEHSVSKERIISVN